MTHVVRIVVGVLIGILGLSLSVFLYGLLAAWSPFPSEWWAHDFRIVDAASKTIAVLPCVVGLGVLLAKLCNSRPVLCATLSMALAVLVGFGSVLRTPDEIGSTVQLVWVFILPFLVVPPMIAYVARSVWPNKALERSRDG